MLLAEFSRDGRLDEHQIHFSGLCGVAIDPFVVRITNGHPVAEEVIASASGFVVYLLRVFAAPWKFTVGMADEILASQHRVIESTTHGAQASQGRPVLIIFPLLLFVDGLCFRSRRF